MGRLSVVVACALMVLGAIMLGTRMAVRHALGEHRTRRQAHPAPPLLMQEAECDVTPRPGLCAYVSSSPACTPVSLVPYTWLWHCGGLPTALLVPLALGWLVLLFYVLATAADDFLVPALRFVSATLRVPPDVAGLTFMALANGAPDVFGTVAAVKNYSYGLSVGELLGSGIYVTTVVVALVSFVSEAKVQASSFVRDVSFYLVGLIVFFGMLSDGYVSLADAIAMMVYYVVYVSVSAVLSVRRERAAARARAALDPISQDEWAGDNWAAEPGESSATVLTSMGPSQSNNYVDDNEEEEEVATVASLAPSTLANRFREQWQSRSTLQRALWLVRQGVTLVLTLTCPDVSMFLHEDPSNAAEWHRGLVAATFFWSPLLFPLAASPLAPSWSPALLWTLPLAVGALLSGAVFATTSWELPPRHVAGRLALSVWSFFVSIAWIYVCANELVALLQMLGVLLNISDVVLGATVLAWGASLGDTVSNVAVARQGSPEMSIGASYGGPLFNLLFGSSLALLVMTIGNYPQPYPAQLGMDSLVSGAFLIFNLVVSLVVVHWHDYTIPRAYGVWLVALYLVYDVLLVLFGTGVIAAGSING